MTPEEQKQHEYLLMEFRLMIEDVKTDHREALSDLSREVIVPMQKEVTILQTSYGFIYGGLALVGTGICYIFYWMFGHVQQAHILSKQMVLIAKNMRVC